ncbi:MAG: c-type cytochrome [Chromatiales bacterium]
MSLKMLPILVIGLAATADGAFAAPSSNVAWTKETRAQLMAADAEAGRAVYDAVNCAKCHGDDGIGDRNYPHLGGLSIAYAYKQLHDYKDGSRENRRMARAMEDVSEGDLADLAAFVSTLPPPPREAAGGGAAIDPVAAEPLVKRGDGERLVPSCNVCHGAEARRTPSNLPLGAPKLDGQKQEYFVTTMLDYRSGDRANDVYGVMRWIARALTEQEIEQLAAYYAGRGAPQMQAAAQP